MESGALSRTSLRSHRNGRTVANRTEFRTSAGRPGTQDVDNTAIPVAAALASRTGRARDSRLVAKAKGALATELVEIAKAHGIAIHSDADLAEILAALEEDAEIPLEALSAVAEILNFLYESQRTMCDESSESHP